MLKRLSMMTACLGLAMLLALQGAGAHTASTYFAAKWTNDLTVDWGFVTTFPGGDYRTRAVDAFTTWNNLGQPLRWVRVGDYADNFDPLSRSCTSTVGRKNSVHYHGGVTSLAVARVCHVSGIIRWAQIIVNTRSDWWTSLDVAPSTHYDLWSAITQEAGHWSGFLRGGPSDNPGHWSEEDETLCPDVGDANYLDRESMCETLPKGTRVMRTPATHDAHTFSAAY